MKRDSEEYSQVFLIFKAFTATKYKNGYIQLGALYTEPQVRLESSGVHLHSRRTLSGVQEESRRTYPESTRSPEGVQEDLPGVHKESTRSPQGL